MELVKGFRRWAGISVRSALVVLVFANAFATSPHATLTKEDADQLAIEFMKAKNSLDFSVLKSETLSRPDCPPDEVSCVKVLCNKTDNCNFESNFNQIASACRGVSGGCVEVFCGKTGGCSFMSGALQAAQSCRGSNGECTKLGCEKTGDCSFASSAAEIAQACVGVNDVACVAFGCNAASCSFRDNFIRIARSCAGN